MQESWSKQIWGLDWNRELPRTISKTIRVDYLRHQAAMKVIQSLFPEVYGKDGKIATDQAFFDATDSGLKQKYYEAAGDYFVFRDTAHECRVVGLAACTFQDWAVYNFRNISIHPDYQLAGIYPEFTEVLCDVLKAHGVSRIEGDLSPTNRHHLGALAKMGYVVTGMHISERWGALTHVCKYLQAEEEDRFCDRFSSTNVSDKASNNRFRKKAGAA